MKFISRILFGASVACFVASALLGAAVQAAPKAGKKGKKVQATPAAFKLPDAITLTAEQQAKVDELKTEYAGKLQDAMKKVNDIYTPEQRKALREARKTAAAEGKKGKQLKQAVDAAVEISADQKQTLADAQKELASLQKEVREKVVALLTDEQKQHIKVKGKGKGKGKNAA
ncbi:MAG TPA: hypothetical protein VHC19_09625 [Pirellulales bacterium]|nr:hypothetical protein [Pirellulales bacterium]